MKRDNWQTQLFSQLYGVAAAGLGERVRNGNEPEMQTAARVELSGRLTEHAVSNGAKAVAFYTVQVGANKEGSGVGGWGGVIGRSTMLNKISSPSLFLLHQHRAHGRGTQEGDVAEDPPSCALLHPLLLLL